METLDATVLEPTEDLDLTEQPEPEPEEPAEGEPAATEDRVDGRRFNPEWSKALKELRELYPDKADMLTKMRDNYARYQALTEIAPKGLEDVRGWKTTIDAVGGPEKAAELLQRSAEYEQIDNRIASADFSVIGELPEDMQKGFYGMLPDALNTLAETDQQKFSEIVAPHFRTALAGTGMGEHLQKMFAAAGDNEPLKEMIRQQYQWFQQQTQGSGEMPGRKTVDPQVQRLQAELNSRREAEDQSFVQATSESAVKYKDEQFTKLAAPYIKQLGLSDSQQQDLQDSFNVKVVQAMEADAAFQAQLKAFKSLKTRNPEQIQSYIKATVDKYAKQTLDGIVTARYSGMRTKAKPATSTTTTTDNGATRVTQAPDQSQWDLDKMLALGHEATVKKGVYHLQGGKTVQLVEQ